MTDEPKPDELVEYNAPGSSSEQMYRVFVEAWNARIICPTCNKTSRQWCEVKTKPGGNFASCMHASRLALAALLV